MCARQALSVQTVQKAAEILVLPVLGQRCLQTHIVLDKPSWSRQCRCPLRSHSSGSWTRLFASLVSALMDQVVLVLTRSSRLHRRRSCLTTGSVHGQSRDRSVSCLRDRCRSHKRSKRLLRLPSYDDVVNAPVVMHGRPLVIQRCRIEDPEDCQYRSLVRSWFRPLARLQRDGF